MKLEEGMILYHGSYAEVSSISLEKCSKGKDFGVGFYLTSDKDQAISFVKTSLKKARNIGDAPMDQDFGFVSSYRLKDSWKDLKTHVFKAADKEWLWFVSQNRKTQLAEQLKDRINREIYSAELIVGKIANDTTNPVITTYLNGLFGNIETDEAVNFAIRQLMPDHLVDQYCFLSEKAISCLEFVEAKKYAV